MTGRSILQLSLLILVLLLAGCGVNAYLTGIQVVPDSGTLQGAGATLQFKAVGTFSNRSHPQHTEAGKHRCVPQITDELSHAGIYSSAVGS
jgi:hypothetical protein